MEPFLLPAALGPLLSAPVLFFLLGALIAALRSELPVPAGFGKALAAYLVVGIGLKGGAALGVAGGLLEHADLLAAAAGLGVLLPLLAFAALHRLVGLDRLNAAAIAAHYGSVSLVTFLAAAEYLSRQGIAHGGQMVAVLAVMEAPAILVGLYLANRRQDGEAAQFLPVLREAATNGSVLLLVGAMAIGWIIGTPGLERLSGFVSAPWEGALCLFLLEMGHLAASRLRDASALSARLVAFGLAMPLAGAALGFAAGGALGLAPGDAMLLAALCASASYIAVPAALRQALPAADPGLSLPLVLAVTFPFNVLVGIPLYAAAAGVSA